MSAVDTPHAHAEGGGFSQIWEKGFLLTNPLKDGYFDRTARRSAKHATFHGAVSSARSLLAVTALRLATMRGGLARSSRKAPKVQIYTLPVKTKARFLALLLRRGDRRPGGILV